jgi:macrolide transport system ATP-binding/permease protein
MSIARTPRARSRSQLVVSDVCVERGGRPVLVDVSFSVAAGTRIGIVGENGRGKSTLLQVLSGELRADAGEVRRIGSLGVAHQEMTVDSHRTVSDVIDIELADIRAAIDRFDRATHALADNRAGADAAYAAALDDATALDAWDADRRVDIALQELGAISDRDRRLSTLSVGERYRVRLACLLGASHDFLLLDEPTNHLDQHGLEFLTEALRTTDAGVVLASHDRALLADVATHIVDLDPTIDGRPRMYGNGYSGYVTARPAELARWAQDYERHQAEQARLADDLAAAQSRLQAGWRPPKGTGKHQRATRAPGLVRAVNRRLDDLRAHDVTKPQAPLQFRLPDLSVLPGVTLLRADHVTVAGRLITPISVELSSGDRLLVTGGNGTGKSTLLAVLAGHLDPHQGQVVASPATRIGWVAQESSVTARPRIARTWSSPPVDRHVVAGGRDVAEAIEDEPGDRGVVALGELDADVGEVVDREPPGHHHACRRVGGDGGEVGVGLVVDLADQLLDEVLDSHDAGAAAVLVDHHGHLARPDCISRSAWSTLWAESGNTGMSIGHRRHGSVAVGRAGGAGALTPATSSRLPAADRGAAVARTRRAARALRARPVGVEHEHVATRHEDLVERALGDLERAVDDLALLGVNVGCARPCRAAPPR